MNMNVNLLMQDYSLLLKKIDRLFPRFIDKTVYKKTTNKHRANANLAAMRGEKANGGVSP